MKVCRTPRPDALGSHHAVAPQQQGRDLADGRRVAVVVAGEVPSPPSAVGHAVLAVVARAEDPVETEEQQNQKDTRSQAQSRHPGWREDGRSPETASSEHPWLRFGGIRLKLSPL